LIGKRIAIDPRPYDGNGEGGTQDTGGHDGVGRGLGRALHVG